MIVDHENVRPIITFTVKSLVVPVFIFVVIASSMNQFIMNQMYLSAEGEMYITFSILIFSFLPLASQYIFGTLLTAGNYLKVLNLTSAIGLVVNIILNYIMIPIYGAKGAAIATISTQVLANGIQLLIAYKKFDLTLEKHYIFRAMILVIGVIGLAYFQSSIKLNEFIKLPLLLLSGLGIAFLLKLFDLHSVFSIIELKKAVNKSPCFCTFELLKNI